MSIMLKIGLVSIPIQLVNVVNNRYTESSLHLFSKCCNAPVKNKQVCETCNKALTKGDIQKGISKDVILTDVQLEGLKTALEGGILEVLSFKDVTETTTYDLLPFVQKCQVVMPSIGKGYKKTNIITYYSFLSALKEQNKYAICKLVSRGCEHLGILIHHKNEILFIEICFKHYSNIAELSSQKEMIEKVIKSEKIIDLESFKEQASNFITNYKSKVTEINEISEEKKVLLKVLVEEIRTGKKAAEIKVSEINPFEVAKC